MTEVFVERPLASPGSANYKILSMSWCGGMDEVVEVQDQGARTSSRLQEVEQISGEHLVLTPCARLRRWC